MRNFIEVLVVLNDFTKISFTFIGIVNFLIKKTPIIYKKVEEILIKIKQKE
ncbi:hypothetical protein H4K33_06645 [Myroides sp. WP-1]|nr:hypothetical protein [Myroides sp. WP-1]